MSKRLLILQCVAATTSTTFADSTSTSAHQPFLEQVNTAIYQRDTQKAVCTVS